MNFKNKNFGFLVQIFLNLVVSLTFLLNLNLIWFAFADTTSTNTTTEEEPCVDDSTGFCLNMPFDENKKFVTGTTVEGEVKPKDSFEIFSSYIQPVYQFAALTAGLVTVLMIVVGGVQYMLYGADPAAKDDAKERITKALMSLVLLLLSGLILHTINPAFFTL